ncbi:hypothetical protein EMIHUDRAFT_217971 [Emiliania huxleyi CCMP1516]|uniref:Ankyrin repeat-containing protein n=2 Tax=Emiliania huxleyi TaxID=2903 RepID=A0A0D3I9M3_EMIH1|nr:hypothetical protein EMIHUDRAFT_217971 [Emiliania huxleyi CCMP1516]EOD07958.1 hypothetical protein EMIHUDRAFT_217971 [Emiliania huxleyi CCMP1516]|eukprot:XP_005760387.1 hypothetical protein EMIHUDRAFT_217971 [Emiliania huxleyi CCMP1516]
MSHKEEETRAAEGEKLTLRVRDKSNGYVPLRLPMYPVAEPGEVGGLTDEEPGGVSEAEREGRLCAPAPAEESQLSETAEETRADREGRSGEGAEQGVVAAQLPSILFERAQRSQAGGADETETAAPIEKAGGLGVCRSGGEGETLAVGETSSVGRLRLELLQRYFVRSREEGQFSPLGEGAAAYRVPVDVASAVVALRSPGAKVDDGSACGWPPLHLALLRGESHLQVVQLLLASGCNATDPPARLEYATPLMLCAEGQLGQAAELLLLCLPPSQLEAAANEGVPLVSVCAQWASDEAAAKVMAARSGNAATAAAIAQLAAKATRLPFGQPPVVRRATRRGRGGKNKS